MPNVHSASTESEVTAKAKYSGMQITAKGMLRYQPMLSQVLMNGGASDYQLAVFEAICEDKALAEQQQEALAEALRLIVSRSAGRCESFTGSWTCATAGRTKTAEYGADQWCDACIAADALSKLEK